MSEGLHRQGLLRIADRRFTRKPRDGLQDCAGWASQVTPARGDDLYRHNGAGERLVYSAADFEDFRVARPDMAPSMEGDPKPVVCLLAGNRWPRRLRATDDETISRALDVDETVVREVPFDGLRRTFDHCGTVSDRNFDRVAALGDGIAVQHGTAFQGECFVAHCRAKAAEATSPIARMLATGLPVGAGTDETRLASCSRWVSLSGPKTGGRSGG